MPVSKVANPVVDGSTELQHWTEALGQPLMIFIFVLIAAHLLAFVRCPSTSLVLLLLLFIRL